MQYAECLQKYYNAVDGTFYDAINKDYGSEDQIGDISKTGALGKGIKA